MRDCWVNAGLIVYADYRTQTKLIRIRAPCWFRTTRDQYWWQEMLVNYRMLRLRFSFHSICLEPALAYYFYILLLFSALTPLPSVREACILKWPICRGLQRGLVSPQDALGAGTAQHWNTLVFSVGPWSIGSMEVISVMSSDQGTD